MHRYAAHRLAWIYMHQEPPPYQIDHVNGGGAKEHKAMPNSVKFYRKVFEDTTGMYQLLCANCNWIKRAENKEHPFRGTV